MTAPIQPYSFEHDVWVVGYWSHSVFYGVTSRTFSSRAEAEAWMEHA